MLETARMIINTGKFTTHCPTNMAIPTLRGLPCLADDCGLETSFIVDFPDLIHETLSSFSKNNTLRLPAFYEVVFVKLQERRCVKLPGRWIGFAILEIGKTTIHPASIFCS